MPLSNETQNIIRTQFKALPQDVQNAILSADLRTKLQTITSKHRLHLDQADALETATIFVMLGLEHPKDYIRNVARELNIGSDAAKQIAVDINEQIFRPIRESLKKIHGVADEETSGEKQETAVEIKQKSEITKRETQNVDNTSQDALHPTPYDTREPEEHPILRLKKEISTPQIQRQNLGWPTRDERAATNTGHPMSSIEERESGAAAPDKHAEDKLLRPLEESKSKPFFKITPDKNRGGEIRRQEPRDEWKPEPPKKEAPPPQNLPVETTADAAPATGTYPVQTQEKAVAPTVPARKEELAGQPRTQLGKIIKSKPNANEKTAPVNPVEEKLSGSFKLSRTETEYGDQDPYREPIA